MTELRRRTSTVAQDKAGNITLVPLTLEFLIRHSSKIGLNKSDKLIFL